MKKRQVIIKVGHITYEPPNHLYMCFSKAQTVRVLRLRGISRRQAMRAVDKVLEKNYSAIVLKSPTGLIELCNQKYALVEGQLMYKNYKAIKKDWKSVPEG